MVRWANVGDCMLVITCLWLRVSDCMLVVARWWLHVGGYTLVVRCAKVVGIIL